MTGPAWWPFLLAPVAACCTLLVTPLLLRRLWAKGIVDQPGERRSHQVPTPRGGGLAMAAGWLTALVPLSVYDSRLLVLMVFAVVLVALGWWDDRNDLSVGWRIVVQLGAAALLVVVVGLPDGVSLSHVTVSASWLWVPGLVVSVVWLINLHNFMDGSDGLAATQGCWSGLVFCLFFLGGGEPLWAAVSLALAAVCLAFLAWNRPPASLFMGDAGSLLIGGAVAWMMVASMASGSASLWMALMVVAVFAVDASLTLLRRVVRGERWYTPHRQHAYQRLIACGWSHGRVLTSYVGTNLLIVLPVILLALRYPALEFWLGGLLLVVLVGLWLKIQSATNGVKTAA